MWKVLEWEKDIKNLSLTESFIKDENFDFEDVSKHIVRSINQNVGLSYVANTECDQEDKSSSSSHIKWLQFCASTTLGEIIILNLNIIYVANERSLCIRGKIHSSDKETISKVDRKIVKSFAAAA
ncbi:MAG: hypothetical protein MHPSP_004749 [Paramarteilia canceri]